GGGGGGGGGGVSGGGGCHGLAKKPPRSGARPPPGPRHCPATENDVSWRLRLAPPGFGEITVERGRRRSADRGPTRDPLGRKIKQRDDIETGDEHGVERAHRGDEIAAVLRFQERSQRCVDGRAP